MHADADKSKRVFRNEQQQQQKKIHFLFTNGARREKRVNKMKKNESRIWIVDASECSLHFSTENICILIYILSQLNAIVIGRGGRNGRVNYTEK